MPVPGRMGRLGTLASLVAALVCQPGCFLVPVSKLHGLKAESEALAEKNKALTVQMENLSAHTRNLEEKLLRTEEALALVEHQREVERKHLDRYLHERDQLRRDVQAWTSGQPAVPLAVRSRLAELAARSGCLRFDPQTGIAKLDTDILFDAGATELAPGAQSVLRDLVAMLQQPEAKEFRVMVVGHTDERWVPSTETATARPDNFDVSIARALAVVRQLRQLGLDEARLGLAGLAAHQNVAPNGSEEGRQKNRRVELFVFSPDVPVIGWTETIPGVY